MKDLSIIIVNWNAKALLYKCIQSIIKETTKYKYDIYVVDNNSNDGSVNLIQNNFPEIKLIANTTNKGFAAANNQALKEVNTEYILLLNPDTEIINKGIDRLIDFYKLNKYDLLTCKLLNTDLSLQPSVFAFHSPWKTFFEKRTAELVKIFKIKNHPFKNNLRIWNHNEIRTIDWARGAVILFKKEMLDKIGLLDEQFYIFGEELDFYYRAKKNGLTAGFVPSIEIIHYGGASTKQKRAEMLILRYKGYYLFLLKHFGKFSYFIHRIKTIAMICTNLLINESENKLIYWKALKWHFSKEGYLLKKKNNI